MAPSPETHRIEAQDILRAVREDTILISMMHVNNETGEVLPVREVAEAVHREHPHTLIHCDTCLLYTSSSDTYFLKAAIT